MVLVVAAWATPPEGHVYPDGDPTFDPRDLRFRIGGPGMVVWGSTYFGLVPGQQVEVVSLTCRLDQLSRRRVWCHAGGQATDPGFRARLDQCFDVVDVAPEPALLAAAERTWSDLVEPPGQLAHEALEDLGQQLIWSVPIPDRPRIVVVRTDARHWIGRPIERCDGDPPCGVYPVLTSESSADVVVGPGGWTGPATSDPLLEPVPTTEPSAYWVTASSGGEELFSPPPSPFEPSVAERYLAEHPAESVAGGPEGVRLAARIDRAMLAARAGDTATLDRELAAIGTFDPVLRRQLGADTTANTLREIAAGKWLFQDPCASSGR